MKQIRFIAFGANSAIGSFAPGDVMRCGADLARHMVEEAKCAEYATASAPEQQQEEAPRRGRKRKEVNDAEAD